MGTDKTGPRTRGAALSIGSSRLPRFRLTGVGPQRMLIFRVGIVSATSFCPPHEEQRASKPGVRGRKTPVLSLGSLFFNFDGGAHAQQVFLAPSNACAFAAPWPKRNLHWNTWGHRVAKPRGSSSDGRRYSCPAYEQGRRELQSRLPCVSGEQHAGQLDWRGHSRWALRSSPHRQRYAREHLQTSRAVQSDFGCPERGDLGDLLCGEYLQRRQHGYSFGIAREQYFALCHSGVRRIGYIQFH